MNVNGINRDIVINTFEGGLDLDTDDRLVGNDKLRNSVNIDITKRGDQAIVVDIKGESILSVFEDSETNQITTLAATPVSFLIQPTSQKKEAIVVFYLLKVPQFNLHYFYIRSVYVDGSTEVILQESISQSDYEFLIDSTVDLDVIGKFGYDVVYFVDNLREPRKLECVIYQTNKNEMTLTFESIEDNVGFKRVYLNLISSEAPETPHRTYVYAYKTGGPMVYIPVNSSTDSSKYLEVDYDGSELIYFDIYPEDYGDYTFEIVYHKEGSNFYRNFTIGDPYKVVIPVGSFNAFIIGLKSSTGFPSISQTGSWEFIYTGIAFTGYLDTTAVEIGVSKVYISDTEDPEDYVPNGYYQRGDLDNTYFKVEDGVIVEHAINNGNITWSAVPSAIESDVRSLATEITEGNVNRLSFASINLPNILESGGVDYAFSNTVVNDDLGRYKGSDNNNYTFIVEHENDLSVVSTYVSGGTLVEATLFNVEPSGLGYNVTVYVDLSLPISESLYVSVRVRAYDSVTGFEITSGTIVVHVPPIFGSMTDTFYYEYGSGNDVDFGPVCVYDYTYTGPEPITIVNECS